ANRAAIRRASQQARNSMRELDRGAIDKLLTLYEDTADQVRAAIRAAGDAEDRVSLQQLRPLLRQIEDLVATLGDQRNALLSGQLQDAAQLGTRPYTAQGVAATGLDAQAVLDSAAAMRINEAAVRFVQEFQADDLRLSDRLWRLDQGARETLGRAIGEAVVKGWDASRAAADLVYNGRPVPADLRQRMAGSQVDQLVRAADLLVDGNDAEVWKAQRVFRTELNRAHGEAYMAGGEKAAGFAGWRFLLSPMHPKPDICDLLSAQNLHGLGPGVYPTREQTPWPAHPNTLSFVVIVFQDEITEADRAGKQTTLDALAGLSAEKRAGALGQTKAAYFDRGLLTTGMVRSPLRAIEQRIERQAQRAGTVHPQALPRARDAVVPPDKLLRYALDPNHYRGTHKALVFERALGITRENYQLLADQLAQGASSRPATFVGANRYGGTYRVDIPVTGPGGSAIVRTGWMVEPGKPPRLTTAFVKK
ncbi:MAG TPA: hypothetical protein VGE70_06145, partial [Burkholderiaceae bacterium]